MVWCSGRLGWYSDLLFFFSSRRRHTRSKRDWSSDVCSSDLPPRPRPDPRSDDRAGDDGGRRRAGTRGRRSEERRVGKECRSRRARHHSKKKIPAQSPPTTELDQQQHTVTPLLHVRSITVAVY